MSNRGSPLTFRISRRHYDIIIKQAVDNLPQESGGFLGGKDFLIQGILPAFNQHLEDRTGTFGVTSEDIARGHAFCEKHGFDYYGVYHSHPKADAYPSIQDIKTGQEYHFIVGLQDPSKPVFLAYHIINNHPYNVPLIVMEDKHFSVKDIHAKSGEGAPSGARPASDISKPIVQRDIDAEAEMLGEMMSNIKKETPKYSKLPPLNLGSDFSTLA